MAWTSHWLLGVCILNLQLQQVCTFVCGQCSFHVPLPSKGEKCIIGVSWGIPAVSLGVSVNICASHMALMECLLQYFVDIRSAVQVLFQPSHDPRVWRVQKHSLIWMLDAKIRSHNTNVVLTCWNSVYNYCLIFCLCGLNWNEDYKRYYSGRNGHTSLLLDFLFV